MEQALAILAQSFAALLAALAAYFAARARREAKQANNAVNNNANPGSVRLYDLASDTHKRVHLVEARQTDLQQLLLSRPCLTPQTNHCPEPRNHDHPNHRHTD